MPAATREVELVLIAKDRSSSTLARISGAFVALGGNIAGIGALSAKEFAQMASSAANVQQQAALAYTQVEGVAKGTINNIRNASLDIARQLPVILNSIQGSFYDLFSTIEIGNMREAKDIVDAFAGSAVAGQAPMVNIAKSTIAWLNALNQEATLENVNNLLRIQFELVRKGAGSYEEISSNVGKAIPAFINAEQRVETFSGVFAFLTRNGLSAAQATTSAARAVELLYSNKGIAGLKELGISVSDINGKTRDMIDIMADLAPHFQMIDGEMKPIDERKALFYELFNQGRIQARRFFDVAIPNLEELRWLTRTMYEGGAGVGLEEAIELMKSQPLSQIQLNANRLQAVSIDMGYSLLSVLTKFLTPAIETLTNAWFDLDEQQRGVLVRMSALASGFAIVSGSALALTGILILTFGVLSKFPLIFAGAAIGATIMAGRFQDVIPKILDNWHYFANRFDILWSTTLNDLAQGNLNFINDWRSEIKGLGAIVESSITQTPLERIIDTWFAPVFDVWSGHWSTMFTYIRNTVIPTELPKIGERYETELKALGPSIAAISGVVFGSPLVKLFSAQTLINEFSKVKAYLQDTEFYSDIGHFIKDDVGQFIENIINPMLDDWSTELVTGFSERGYDELIPSLKGYIDSFLMWWGDGGIDSITDAAKALNIDIISIINSSIKIIIGLLDTFVTIGAGLTGIDLNKYSDIEALNWDDLVDRALHAVDLLVGLLSNIGNMVDALANEEYTDFIQLVDTSLATVVDDIIDTVFGIINYIIDVFQGEIEGGTGGFPTETIKAMHESLVENWDKTVKNLFGGDSGDGGSPQRPAGAGINTDNNDINLGPLNNPWIVGGGIAAALIGLKATIKAIPRAISAVFTGLIVKGIAFGKGATTGGTGGIPTGVEVDPATYQAYKNSLQTVNNQLIVQEEAVDLLTNRHKAYSAAINRNAQILDNALDLTISPAKDIPHELDDLKILLSSREVLVSQIAEANKELNVAYDKITSPTIKILKDEVSVLGKGLDDFAKQFGNLVDLNIDDIAKLSAGFSPSVLGQLPPGDERIDSVMNIMRNILGDDHAQISAMQQNLGDAQKGHKVALTAMLNDLNETYISLVDEHKLAQENLTRAINSELDARKQYHSNLVELDRRISLTISESSNTISRSGASLNKNLQTPFDEVGTALKTAETDVAKLADEATSLTEQLKTMVPTETKNTLAKAGRFLTDAAASGLILLDVSEIYFSYLEEMEERVGMEQQSIMSRIGSTVAELFGKDTDYYNALSEVDTGDQLTALGEGAANWATRLVTSITSLLEDAFWGTINATGWLEETPKFFQPQDKWDANFDSDPIIQWFKEQSASNKPGTGSRFDSEGPDPEWVRRVIFGESSPQEANKYYSVGDRSFETTGPSESVASQAFRGDRRLIGGTGTDSANSIIDMLERFEREGPSVIADTTNIVTSSFDSMTSIITEQQQHLTTQIPAMYERMKHELGPILGAIHEQTGSLTDGIAEMLDNLDLTLDPEIEIDEDAVTKAKEGFLEFYNLLESDATLTEVQKGLGESLFRDVWDELNVPNLTPEQKQAIVDVLKILPEDIDPEIMTKPAFAKYIDLISQTDKQIAAQLKGKEWEFIDMFLTIPPERLAELTLDDFHEYADLFSQLPLSIAEDITGEDFVALVDKFKEIGPQLGEEITFADFAVFTTLFKQLSPLIAASITDEDFAPLINLWALLPPRLKMDPRALEDLYIYWKGIPPDIASQLSMQDIVDLFVFLPAELRMDPVQLEGFYNYWRSIPPEVAAEMTMKEIIDQFVLLPPQLIMDPVLLEAFYAYWRNIPPDVAAELDFRTVLDKFIELDSEIGEKTTIIKNNVTTKFGEIKDVINTHLGGIEDKTVTITTIYKTIGEPGDPPPGTPGGGPIPDFTETDPEGSTFTNEETGQDFKFLGGKWVALAEGGMTLSEGFAYLHPKEMILPAARAEKLDDTDLSLMKTSNNLAKTVDELRSTVASLERKLASMNMKGGGDTYHTYVETNADPDQIGEAIAFEARLR